MLPCWRAVSGGPPGIPASPQIPSSPGWQIQRLGCQDRTPCHPRLGRDSWADLYRSTLSTTSSSFTRYDAIGLDPLPAQHCCTTLHCGSRCRIASFLASPVHEGTTILHQGGSCSLDGLPSSSSCLVRLTDRAPDVSSCPLLVCDSSAALVLTLATLHALSH